MLTSNSYDENLGDLELGKAHNFKYILTNSSDKQIEIKQVALGCHSCTKVTYSKRTLLSGESMDLDVTYTPGSLGISIKSVSVIYEQDGLVNPNLVLKFRSKIK